LGPDSPPSVKGKTPGDYVQIHHIIPQQLCEGGGKAHELLVQLAAHGLFVRDDLEANGVALPTVARGSGGLGSKRTIHQGPHPIYADWINSQLDGIHVTYGGNLEVAANRVAAFQTMVKGHLVAGAVPPGAAAGFGDRIHRRKFDAAHVSTTK